MWESIGNETVQWREAVAHSLTGDTAEHEWQESSVWSMSSWMGKRHWYETHKYCFSASTLLSITHFVSFCPCFTIAWLISMKSLWAPTNMSNMATVTTPRPVNVGISHSSLSSSDMVTSKQSWGTCICANEVRYNAQMHTQCPICCTQVRTYAYTYCCS